MGSKMTVPIPFFDVIAKELHVVGSFRYGPGDYPLAISLVERGLIDLKPLVTQRYEFTDALEAFEMTRRGKDESGKVSSVSRLACVESGAEWSGERVVGSG
jgi:D-xylulose reductase